MFAPGGSMRWFSVAATAACLALPLTTQPAAAQAAQILRSSTTFVVLPAEAPAGELTASAKGPLLRQKIASTRAAQLDEAAPTTSGFAVDKTFPAGAKLFGVKVPDGWIYCAVAKKLFGGQFDCYQDIDDDGRFDVARPSGLPFNDVPLFVFAPGPATRLPAPVRYSALNYRDGPTTDIAIFWQPVKPPGARGARPPIPRQITWNVAAVRSDGRAEAISQKQMVTMPPPGQSVSIRSDGAVITLLGFTPEGQLRYRIDRTMPAQVQLLEMTLMTPYLYSVY